MLSHLWSLFSSISSPLNHPNTFNSFPHAISHLPTSHSSSSFEHRLLLSRSRGLSLASRRIAFNNDAEPHSCHQGPKIPLPLIPLRRFSLTSQTEQQQTHTNSQDHVFLFCLLLFKSSLPDLFPTNVPALLGLSFLSSQSEEDEDPCLHSSFFPILCVLVFPSFSPAHSLPMGVDSPSQNHPTKAAIPLSD